MKLNFLKIYIIDYNIYCLKPHLIFSHDGQVEDLVGPGDGHVCLLLPAALNQGGKGGSVRRGLARGCG